MRTHQNELSSLPSRYLICNQCVKVLSVHSFWAKFYVSSVLATAKWVVVVCVRFRFTRWKLIRNALRMFLRCYFGRKCLILSERTLECVTIIRTVPLRPGRDWGHVSWIAPEERAPRVCERFYSPFLMFPCSSSGVWRFLASVLNLIQPKCLPLKTSGQSVQGTVKRTKRMQETVVCSTWIRIGFWRISLKIFFIWNLPIFINMD